MSPEEPGGPGGWLRAVVDRDECFGFANCVATAPMLFHLDAEGTSVAADLAADATVLEAAVDGCPRSAISLIRVGVHEDTSPR